MQSGDSRVIRITVLSKMTENNQERDYNFLYFCHNIYKMILASVFADGIVHKLASLHAY